MTLGTVAKRLDLGWWIKVPVGTEVGLGPDDTVLDGDPAETQQKGALQPLPLFGPLLWHGRLSQQLLSSCFFSGVIWAPTFECPSRNFIKYDDWCRQTVVHGKLSRGVIE